MPKGGAPQQNKIKVRSQVIIDTLNALGYSFRFNELTHVLEVNGSPISDAIAAAIRTSMRDMDFKGMDAIEDAYVSHAQQNAYHPIRDYFDSLRWDGRCHIAQLATFFQDSGPVNGETWFYKSFRRWLIGYAARVYDHMQLPMLVLEGLQRKGKSYFVRWLSSMLPQYFIEAPIMPDNKDCLLRLATTFIWEVSELGATMRRADVEALKSFITLHHITLRKPYGRHDLHLPAVAGLIGTINDASGFLNDTTGSRRALVIPNVEIDWSYVSHVDVNQVWAEAVAAYRAGESNELDDVERITQATINSTYETPNSVEDLILERFDIDPDKITDPDWFTSANDVRYQVDLELRGTSQQHALMIAAVLKKHGAIKVNTWLNGKKTRGYWGVKRRGP